jgi:large subunit ribosomal protein L30
MSTLKITYKKSAIGYSQRQKDTIRSLGLRKLGQSVSLPDNGAIRGMVQHVRHLVVVEENADEGARTEQEA